MKGRFVKLSMEYSKKAHANTNQIVKNIDEHCFRLKHQWATNTIFVIMFIISQLWLTSHPRSTVVLLDTGTPGTSRAIYSEDADDETRIRNPSVINRVLKPLS